jgi:hypothetical protein
MFDMSVKWPNGNRVAAVLTFERRSGCHAIRRVPGVPASSAKAGRVPMSAATGARVAEAWSFLGLSAGAIAL